MRSASGNTIEVRLPVESTFASALAQPCDVGKEAEVVAEDAPEFVKEAAPTIALDVLG